MPRLSRGVVATLAVALTYLFWFEYLPPFNRIHLHSDIEGYHWPLLVAALEAIRHGRFPLWDASIYCGIPFSGNIQAALFYPPVWLLFAANLWSRHLLFKTLEAWTFLHGALALFLCYSWLRNRDFSLFASVLGGMGFAFGGYMVSQNIHVGVVTGYAWTPLAWWGIDQFTRSKSFRPLWKVVAASALCFLAGYPASFVAFAVGTTVYAVAGSWRRGLTALTAIAAGLAVSAIQLLPAAEASGSKAFDPKYGSGVWDPLFYVNFVVPDWGGFKFGDPYMYLYLGVPCLFGIPWIIRRPDRAVVAVLAVSAWFVLDPGGLIFMLADRTHLLVQVLSNYSFIEPATLAFAFAGAHGVDSYLRASHPAHPAGRASGVFAWAVSGLLVIWSLYRFLVWPKPVIGWRSLFETSIILGLFVMGLFVIRRGRTWVAIIVCAAVFVDYKVSGTSHPFSSVRGDLDPYYPRGIFPGLDAAPFDAMRDHREFRIAVDGIAATDLRRYGLASPQGFDPLLSTQYKSLIEHYRPFRTNRLFDIAPHDHALRRNLGVRYFITRDGAPFQAEIESDPGLRRIGGPAAFLRVYEDPTAAPPWQWHGKGTVNLRRWDPEHRDFQLTAETPGQFVLIEQFSPGWRASIDGHQATIGRFQGVFESISVPSGPHAITFEYSPASLKRGAAISAVSLIGLAIWLRKRK